MKFPATFFKKYLWWLLAHCFNHKLLNKSTDLSFKSYLVNFIEPMHWLNCALINSMRLNGNAVIKFEWKLPTPPPHRKSLAGFYQQHWGTNITSSGFSFSFITFKWGKKYFMKRTPLKFFNKTGLEDLCTVRCPINLNQ
jgi:hypothetical protein